MKRSWLFWLGVQLCAGCGGASFPPIDSAEIPARSAYPEADKVVLDDTCDVRFEPGSTGPKMRTLCTRRTVVLATEPTTFRLGTWHRAGTRDVVRYDVRARFPDGRTRIWSLDDFVDVPVVAGYALFAETRAHALTLTLPPKTVLDVQHEVLLHEVRLKAAAFDLEESIPVRRKQIRVRAPAGWTLAPHAWHLGRPIDLPPAATVDGQRFMAWQFDNLPAVKSDNYDLRVSHLGRRLAIQLVAWPTGRGWASAQEMGAALAQSYAALRAVPAETATWAKAQIAQIEDPHQQARHLAEWVRDAVRYCAISIGMGGYIPHAASAVLKHRYGDCKDQATLIVALLEQVNIPASVVLVRAGKGLRAPFKLPVLGQNYNHAIVRVDFDPPVYFDPTRRWVPFGEVGAGIAGAQVLPVTETPQLTRIPENTVETDNIYVHAELSFTGLAWQGETTVEAKGLYAHRLRARVGDADALQGPALEAVLPGDLTVKTVHAFTDPKQAGNPLKAKVTIEIEQPGVGAPLVLRPHTLGRPFYGAIPKDAQTPVRLGAPRRRHWVHRFEWPHPVQLPAPITLECAAGRYTQTWTRQGKHIELRREIDVRTRIAARESTRAWINAIQHAEAQPVILEAP